MLTFGPKARMSRDTLQFLNTLGLSQSKQDINQFHLIRAIVRSLVHEHFDLAMTWDAQTKENRDAFEAVASPNFFLVNKILKRF
jgi:hypothetical protein